MLLLALINCHLSHNMTGLIPTQLDQKWHLEKLSAVHLGTTIHWPILW